MSIRDFYPTLEEFENALDDAEINAARGWETDFVDSLRDRYEDYGDEMNFSEAQADKLAAIRLGTNSSKHVRY